MRSPISIKDDLERRLKLIVRETKQLPTDSGSLDLAGAPSMREIPYWSELLDKIKESFGSLPAFYQERFQQDFLQQMRLPFPSPDQDETVTQMLERSSLLIRDKAGAGKTAPAIKIKYALEQLVHNGEKINTVVVCPNFVVSSWEAKLREYTTEKPRVLKITSKNRKEQLPVFEKEISAGNLDFTILSYDTLFRTVNQTDFDSAEFESRTLDQEKNEIDEDPITLADHLVRVYEKSQKPLLFILDEGHHAKNPEALRSKAVRKIRSAADNFYILTASPLPDYIDDIYEMASLLDENSYPTAEEAKKILEQNPALIRLFFRRFSKEPVIGLEDIPGAPKVTYNNPINVELSRDEREVYDIILNHPLSIGSKMALLRLAATDVSSLINRESKNGKLNKKIQEILRENPGLEEVIQRADSSKYLELDRLIGEIASRGEKVVVWTKLRDGITDKLQKRYESFGSIKIDGTVDAEPRGNRYSERDIRRLTFQTNPDISVLVATIDSLREGQDVHSANNVIFIQRDYSPGKNDQAVGRCARRGQQKDVNVFTINSEATIDKGTFKQEETKRSGISAVEKGVELSKSQKEALQRSIPLTQQKPIKRYLMDARQVVRLMSGKMLNKGSSSNRLFLDEGENALIYAQAYNYLWNYSYSAHAARLITKLVQETEGSNPLESIIDIGSGPATLARSIQRSMLCLDLNPHQLRIGKEECEKLGIKIHTKVADAENLSEINTEEFNLAALSLMLHYGRNETGGRVRTILEANRVLQPGGYAIITLPPSIIQSSERDNFETGLDSLGLSPISGRTGYVRALDGSKDFQIYVALCKKTHGNPAEAYTDPRYNSHFVLNPTQYTRDLSSRSCDNQGTEKSPTQYRREICTEFIFTDTGEVLSFIPSKKKDDNKLIVPVEGDMTAFLDKLNNFMRKKK